MSDDAPIRKIVMSRVVGSPFCVSIEDGAKVQDAIVDAFSRGERVAISFDGIERLTTAFLNSAVGQLYDTYQEATIGQFMMPPEGATQDQLRLLVRVVENAKRFFSSPEHHRKILGQALRDE